MKKRAAAILAVLLFVALLASCAKRGSSASPGDLVVETHIPHVGQQETDVSSQYLKRLCLSPWLDSASFRCYSLHEDGSYQIMENKSMEKQLSSGTWVLKQDEESYLALYLTDALSGETTAMYELELYEKSLYACSAEGEAFLWLLPTE